MYYIKFIQSITKFLKNCSIFKVFINIYRIKCKIITFLITFSKHKDIMNLIRNMWLIYIL